MKRWLLGVLLFLVPASAWGACSWVGQTGTAADATVAEVQACINGVTSSMSGAVTINIPAGTETWASGVTVNMGDVTDPAPNFTGVTLLKIAGAGRDATHITRNGSFNLFAFTGKDGKKFRFTGIELKFAGSAGGEAMTIVGDAGRTTGASAGFLIDNVRIQVSDKTYGLGLWIKSVSYGVIHSSQIYGARILLFGASSTDAEMDSVYQGPLGLGGDKYVFIEDCTFDGSSTYLNSGQVMQGSDGRYAARLTYRFNTLVDTDIETHEGAVYSTATRGMHTIEAYHNTLVRVDPVSSRNVDRFMLFRSGTGMVFNNWASTTVFANKIIDLEVEYACAEGRACGDRWYNPEVDGYHLTPDGSTKPCCSGYPCQDQVGRGQDGAGGYGTLQTLTPIYAWGNTWGGATREAGTNMPAQAATAICDLTETGANVVVANRDFYTYTASFTGATGVGVGLKSALPNTCTLGVAFWVTDEGYWNSKTVGADGVLYKCTATNVWTPYYTPYPYPHPLRSGLSAPTGVTAE